MGSVEILDYVVVEDCGVVVNPMVVEGQTIGGVAQGIGTALYEEMPYDTFGQPLASTLADYTMPGATEVPNIRIDHLRRLLRTQNLAQREWGREVLSPRLPQFLERSTTLYVNSVVASR
jgi:CO/xanthine dehydrogenase Mo-binding subunit